MRRLVIHNRFLWSKSMANFQVIEGGGERSNAERDIAEQDLADALREAAANFLRVIRGAGRPGALIKQFHAVVVAAIDFREVAGHGPPAGTLATILAYDDEADEIFAKHASGQVKQESIDRWDEDGTFDRMYAEGAIQRGALQIIASKLLDQAMQVSAGKSEMHEGLRRLIAARERHRKFVEANSSVKMVRKKRDRKPAPLPSKPGPRTP
jgi:hypothetical protein